MMSDKPRMVVKIDEAEAVCRYLEAITGVSRPPGVTAAELLDAMLNNDALPAADTAAKIRRGIKAVLDYFAECVEHALEVKQ